MDKEDFRKRQIHTCRNCGMTGDGLRCRNCGGRKFDVSEMDYEELTEDLERHMRLPIEAAAPEGGSVQSFDTAGNLLVQTPGGFSAVHVIASGGTKLPYYTPKKYPLVMRKNISKHGQFLGGSDSDVMESAQNNLNKIETRKMQKVLGGGSVLIKPSDLDVVLTDEQYRVIEVDKPNQVNMIGVRNLQVDVSPDMAAGNEMYEESRQAVGVTDSLQGRRDPTATSMVAKQFSEAQAAGRLQSKKSMKEDFFADLFRAIFELELAYADEPRTVRVEGDDGKTEFMEFDRHDFLKQDAAGEWYYEDQFLFECDASATLAQDREKLWQETRANLQQGAYGDPNNTKTLLTFWRIMEKLAYPMAGTAIKSIEAEIEAAQAQAQAEAQAEPTPMPQQTVVPEMGITGI